MPSKEPKLDMLKFARNRGYDDSHRAIFGFFLAFFLYS
jgi:hypothetical protein